LLGGDESGCEGETEREQETTHDFSG
jgi:hypothetical protein